MKIAILALLTSTLIYSQYVPSKERGEVKSRAQSSLESNSIRTTIFNHGQTGRYGGDFPLLEQTPYEWPKGTGQVYLALTMLFVGAEITDEDGNKQTSIITSNYRTSPYGMSWNFEPVPGYYNTENTSTLYRLASSKHPETWPEYWPDKLNDNSDSGWSGSWDGYFGKNHFIDGEEIYYKMSDNLYSKYNYYPDSTDTTRKGLGLIVECRAFQFEEVPFQDMVFHSYLIKNDGTKPLDKMGLTFWVADFVGGNGDSNDDYVNYDTTKNLVWFYDKDNSAPTFGTDPVGMLAVSFLNTPISINDEEETGITNIQKIATSGLNLNSDATMWFDFMIPGEFFNPPPYILGEFDYFISSSFFELLPGESDELITAILLANGNDYEEKFEKVKSKNLVAGSMQKAGFIKTDFELDFTSDPSKSTLSDEVEIEWSLAGTSGETTSFIYHSSDYGTNWEMIAIDSLGENKITWNTESVPDGVLNKLLIYSFADNGYDSVSTGAFIINNQSNDGIPQIFLTKPNEGEEVSGNYKICWLGGDPEGENVVINIFYKTSSAEEGEKIYSTEEGEGNFLWSTNNYANSNQATLKAIISTEADTSEYQTPPFILYNERDVLDDDNIDEIKNIHATGWIEYHVIDSTKLTGHTYLLEFDQIEPDSRLVYNLYDYSIGTQLLYNVEVIDSTIEGPLFDGLRLIIQSDPFRFIESKSGWNTEETTPYVFERIVAGSEEGVNDREDYQVIISDEIIDSSKLITFLDLIFPVVPVYFKAQSLISGEKLPFGFIELDSSSGVGKFSVSGAFRDRIVMLKKDEPEQVFTNWIYLDPGLETGFRQPEAGDTLNIFQTKPFLAGDSLFFSTGIVNSAKDNKIINNFELSQNFPNPFNPTTKILFSIPHDGITKLVVYDILGREVNILINKELKQGRYSVEFDGRNLSTGVYFYRLITIDYINTKKMLLLK